MSRYKLLKNYANKRGHGPWLKDATVELAPQEADWIERQSPGTLLCLDAPAAPIERALEAPPHDRMIRKPTTTRGDE